MFIKSDLVLDLMNGNVICRAVRRGALISYFILNNKFMNTLFFFTLVGLRLAILVTDLVEDFSPR